MSGWAFGLAESHRNPRAFEDNLVLRPLEVSARCREARRSAFALLAIAWLAADGARAEARLSRFRMADEPLVSERVIDQREWALELAVSLGIADALGDEPREDDVFALLCAGRADRAADGGQPAPSGAPFRVAFDAPAARRLGEPIRVLANLPYAALYALSVTGIGAQRWAVDGRTIDHLDPTPLGVAQAKSIVPLPAGPHELTAYLSHGARVDRIELAAYRPFCVAPAAGWQAGRLLTFASSARTLVAALGLERRLPVEDVPLSIEGEHYQSASAHGGATNRRLADPASGGAWAVAVDRPAEFSYRARIQQPGVYSLIARVQGDGDELWSIGEDYRVSIRPAQSRDGFAWVHVLTLHLSGGEHLIRALLPSGAGIDTLHLLRRRARDADYIALLEDEGFRSGVPKQPVTQTDAYRSLSQPLFAEIASQFLARLGDDFQRAPWWVRRDEKKAIRPALRFAAK